MKSKLIFLFSIWSFTLEFSCAPATEKKTSEKNQAIDLAVEKLSIANTLDSFNRAAANANYDAYFQFFSDDATFLGTDATERWDKSQFMVWAKPFFDSKHTWDFRSMSRNISLSPAGNLAWFDELLNTPMKICRGSGILVKNGAEWKVRQYVLSMTIPNSQIDAVIPLKAPTEDSIISTLAK